jgi:hypothetical protein
MESAFEKPHTDDAWAQALADRGQEHLARLLSTKTASVPDRLDAARKRCHREGKVPKLENIATELKVTGARDQELFRWSLYLYTDGDASHFDVRRSPHLVQR